MLRWDVILTSAGAYNIGVWRGATVELDQPSTVLITGIVLVLISFPVYFWQYRKGSKQ